MAVVALLVALGACGGDEGDSSSAPVSTAAPTATSISVPSSTTPLEPVVTDELTDLAADVREGGTGSLLLTVAHADGTLEYGSAGPPEHEVRPDTPLRVGSVTKVAVAVLTLQLVDGGELSLDDPVADHSSRLIVPEDVTIRHLLENRSGLVDFVAVVPDLVADPSRVWTPEEILAEALTRDPSFRPGERFEYSNTNYIVLGVLIEEATGGTLDEAFDARISGPLGMRSTFLGGPAEPAEVMPSTGQGDTPYTAIATAAWAAGGLVSNAIDLHLLMTGLFEGRLLSESSLEEMTADPNGDGYGLGIYDEGDGRYGHGGGVPGYRVQLTHDSRTGATVFAATNDDSIDFAPVLGALYDRTRES